MLFNKVIQKFGKDLSNKTFSIWGLSFKPGTDDMREAPSVVTIKSILGIGGKVQVFDPAAKDTAKIEFSNEELSKIKFCDSEYDTLIGADAMILITEWGQFRQPDFNRIKSVLNKPIIFDGRNQYNPDYLSECGFEYYGIGRSNK